MCLAQGPQRSDAGEARSTCMFKRYMYYVLDREYTSMDIMNKMRLTTTVY